MGGWRAIALVGVLGCGRIHFEQRGDAGGSGDASDAPGDAAGGMLACAERAPITGNTWWVAAPPTGSDANAGSQTAPVATITRALQLAGVGGGGTVVVRPGTYDAEPGDEIVVDATVPIRLLAEIRYTARVPRILCFGCTDLVVEAFEVTGSTQAALHVASGTRVRFIDNVVHNSGSVGVRLAGTPTAVDVIGNLIYDTDATPIHLNDATDVELRDNVMFFDSVTPNGQGMIWLEQASSVVASGNVLFRMRGSDSAYGMISLRDTSATLIENNVIGASPSAASVYASIGFDLAPGSASIRHNTFVGPLPGNAFGLGVDTVMAGASFTLENNLWASAGTTQPFTSGNAGGLVRLRYNGYWNAPNGAFSSSGSPAPSADPNALIADPGLPFAVPIAPTWSPVGRTFAGGHATICDTRAALVEELAAIPSTSPVVGAADPASTATVDIRGRPRGARKALGAYEPGP